jgi:hypothetical protein
VAFFLCKGVDELNFVLGERVLTGVFSWLTHNVFILASVLGTIFLENPGAALMR